MFADESMVQKILARCHEDGDCLIWDGAISDCGLPRLAKTSARRSLWRAMFGELHPRQLVSCTCDSKLCLNPEHLELRNKSDVTRSTQTAESRLKRSRSMTPIARARGKLNPEAVAEIRSTTTPLKILAEKFGVHFSLIGKVRNGQSWRDNTNPWLRLGA